MSKDNRSGKQPGTRTTWFTILLLLDAFVLGGLVVWRLVLNVLESAAAQATNPDAIGTYFHVDNLFVPYWVSHAGIMLLLVVITAGAFVWLKIRHSAA